MNWTRIGQNLYFLPECTLYIRIVLKIDLTTFTPTWVKSSSFTCQINKKYILLLSYFIFGRKMLKREIFYLKIVLIITNQTLALQKYWTTLYILLKKSKYGDCSKKFVWTIAWTYCVYGNKRERILMWIVFLSTLYKHSTLCILFIPYLFLFSLEHYYLIAHS